MIDVKPSGLPSWFTDRTSAEAQQTVMDACMAAGVALDNVQSISVNYDERNPDQINSVELVRSAPRGEFTVEVRYLLFSREFHVVKVSIPGW